MTPPPTDNEARANAVYPWECTPWPASECLVCDSSGMCHAHLCIARIAAALDAAEARERDRWTREVQHRFDTCEARHVDEWRAFAVKMGVTLIE